jgi:hypothetical protein
MSIENYSMRYYSTMYLILLRTRTVSQTLPSQNLLKDDEVACAPLRCIDLRHETLSRQIYIFMKRLYNNNKNRLFLFLVKPQQDFCV